MVEVYLGLGSNLGDRLALMKQAVALMEASGHLQAIRVSSLYETAPVGYTDQPPFLNAVVTGLTEAGPQEILAMCQAVERQLNRVRLIRWGPRTIDVDVLLYGTEVIAAPDLIVPHPRLFERAFALMPLAEIASPAVCRHYQLSERSAALTDQDIRRLEPNETNIEWNNARG